MAVEDDAEEVEDFALLKFGAAPDGGERGQMDLLGAVFGAHAQDDGAVLLLHREQVIDDFKIADGVGFPDFFDLFLDAVDELFHFYFFGDFFSGPVDAGDVGAVVETEMLGVAKKCGDGDGMCGVDQQGMLRPTGWGWE